AQNRRFLPQNRGIFYPHLPQVCLTCIPPVPHHFVTSKISFSAPKTPFFCPKSPFFTPKPREFFTPTCPRCVPPVPGESHLSQVSLTCIPPVPHHFVTSKISFSAPKIPFFLPKIAIFRPKTTEFFTPPVPGVSHLSQVCPTCPGVSHLHPTCPTSFCHLQNVIFSPKIPIFFPKWPFFTPKPRNFLPPPVPGVSHLSQVSLTCPRSFCDLKNPKKFNFQPQKPHFFSQNGRFSPQNRGNFLPPPAPGPPESMREHVVAASKAMKTGDWRRCHRFVVNEKMNGKVWDLFPEADQVRAMLVR
ncbi:hypothetical protein DV515_00019563, partial [Chloebia gouldiae]